MSRHLLVAATTAALFALMPTSAAAQDLPPILRAERERIAAECLQMGGRFAPGPNYTQTADFNGDGVPDYLVDDNHNPCQGAHSIYCGSGGCSIEVYISSPSGHRRANLAFLGSPAVIRRGETPPAIALSGRGGSFVVRWDGQRFSRISATAARQAAGGTAATPTQPGPGADALFGTYVFESAGCSPPTQGVIIGRDSIVVDWGGDQTTYRTSFEGCRGGVCTFRERGSRARWSVRQLAADRIIIRGLFGPGGSEREEAVRERPGCLGPR